MHESPEERDVLLTLARQLQDSVLHEAVPQVKPAKVRQILVRLAEEDSGNGKPAKQTHFSQSPTWKTGDTFQLFTDGAARGNPGEAGAGAVLIGPDGSELGTRSLYLGQCTNNGAEYYALIAGLELAHEYGCEKLEISLDSELIVRQVQGVYKVKNTQLKQLYAKVISQLAEFAAWEIRHVPRKENGRADELANRGIDEK